MSHEFLGMHCEHRHPPDEMEYIQIMKKHHDPINVKRREYDRRKKQKLQQKSAKHVIKIR